MHRVLTSVLFAAIASPLLAQICPERNLGVVVGNGDDVMLTIQPIGFAFPFAGTTYTDVHICTNGFFHLSNAGTPAPGGGDGTSTAAELASGSPRICPKWSDDNLLAANGANVYINSSPAKCTITWDRAVNFGGTTLFSYQAQLFPTGEIRFIYDANTTNNSTFSAAYAAGLVGLSPGGGVTLPAASDFSLGGTTTDNTLFETFAALGFDMQGLTVQIIPTNPGYVWLVAPPSGCASSTNYGVGCYKNPDSFYEFFSPAAAMDLTGKTITMLRNSTGYTVLDAFAGMFQPTTNAATIVVGDDVTAPVALSAPMPVPGGGTTSSLHVSSNGVITLSPTGIGAAWTPGLAAFLGWAQTAVCCWHDYNNTLGGSVKFEEAGGIAYVTWDAVVSHQTTVADTLQFQFNLATGDITMMFVTMGAAGNNYLVGYSVAGASADPGATDLSNTLAYPINVADVPSLELQLTSVGVPFIGNSAYALEVRNVPATSPAAAVFFGSAQAPGTDLIGLGMPGCKQWSTAEFGAFATLPTVGTTAQIPFPMPANPSLVGASATVQGAALAPGANPFGVIVSNGTEIVVGY